MDDGDSAATDSIGANVLSDARGALGPAVHPAAPGSADAGPHRPDEHSGSDPDDAGDGNPTSGDGGANSTELTPADQEIIAEIVQDAVREAVHVAVESFSGPVPQAKDLKEYTPDQQERILRMAEAPRTDESERRTLVTKAGISSNLRSSIIQPVLFVICLALSAVSFWIYDNNIAGGVFLSYPVLNFLSGVRWNWTRRNGNRKSPDQS